MEFDLYSFRTPDIVNLALYGSNIQTLLENTTKQTSQQPITVNFLFQNNQNDLYVKNKYNKRTTEYYKTLRKTHEDPITCEIVSVDGFQYPYMWDAYTGEVLGKDPYGPLWFDANNLIYFLWLHRLDGLWTQPNDPTFEGFYDVCVGAGENIDIVSRGSFPERYLFRLPIIDCYLTDDHSPTVTTLGPKLTNQDIETLYQCGLKTSKEFTQTFGRPLPNIVQIKKYYDQAIFKRPPNVISSQFKSRKQESEYYNKLNRDAVEALKYM